MAKRCYFSRCYNILLLTSSEFVGRFRWQWCTSISTLFEVVKSQICTMRRLNSMSRIKSCQSPLPPFILHGPPEMVCKMMFLLIIESLPYLQVFHVFSRKKSGHVWGLKTGHLGPSWAILWRLKRCCFSGATDLLLSLRGFGRPRPLPPVPPDDPNCWWASWRGDRPRAEIVK